MAKEDYTNPSYKRSDHPSFQEKKHTLLIDSQGASNKEIRTESGTLRFEDGVAVLPDDTRAKDIYDELLTGKDAGGNPLSLHPGQYSLVEDKPTVNVDPIHRYTFGYNRRFSKAWERIFGSANDSESEEDKKHGRKDTDHNTERSPSNVHADA